jgi:chromosome partitioning protein
MGKTIAVAQHKGGTGKTTTCINLGASLCLMGKKVLLVDIDPQASLSVSLGINPVQIEKSVHDLLINPEVKLSEVVQSSEVTNLFIVPSHVDLAMVELEVAGKIGREKLLKKKLEPAKEDFDFIFIDCPPTLGTLTINAFAAADSVLVPVQSEPLALYGMKHLLQLFHLVKEELNPSLKLEGVLITMLDRRTRVGQDTARSIKDTFGDLVYRTVICRHIKLAEGPVCMVPAPFYARNSQASQEYQELAEEFLKHEN